MISIIQRVSQAKVTVAGQDIGVIDQGIMALLAVEKEDTEKDANYLIEKIIKYRIFSDDEDKMNLSLRDIQGGLLLVPQFTLAADTRKSNRPSFACAAPPAYGKEMFEYVKSYASSSYPNCQFGQFGADMKVSLINDGPVTFTLRSI